MVVINTETQSRFTEDLQLQEEDYVLLHMPSLVVIHFNIALFADILQISDTIELFSQSHG